MFHKFAWFISWRFLRCIWPRSWQLSSVINRLIKLKIFAQLQPSILVFIHPLIYQFISSSIHPSISFNSSINQSILHPSNLSPFHLYIHPSIHQLILLFIHNCPFIHPSILQFIHQSLNSSIHLSILCIHIFPFIHQFISSSVISFIHSLILATKWERRDRGCVRIATHLRMPI